MAEKTGGGTVASFSNTPQARDDLFLNTGLTEDLLSNNVVLDVLGNDAGGNAKTLWSLDNASSPSTATKIPAPSDLLSQDVGRTATASSDTSFNGARIWIGTDGKVHYDATTLSSSFKL